MELTASYQEAFPPATLERYDFAETRNAARICQATNAEAFSDLIGVLDFFHVDETLDLAVIKGQGNETDVAKRINQAFRDHGWVEGQYSVAISAQLSLRAAGTQPTTVKSDTEAASYLIDNLKGRVAIDTEWEAKDGNLDRDLAAYRALYDAGIIDCAAMVTKNRAALRAWAQRLTPKTTKFGTSTVTSLEKVTPRLLRGDSGGCPVLVVAACERTI